MALIVKRPWTSQPQVAAGASSWAASRKVRILTTADPQFNAARGSFTPATITSGTRVLKASPLGLAFSQPSGASSVNSVGDLLLRESWTILVLAAPVSAAIMHSVVLQYGLDEQRIGFNFDDQFAAVAGRFSVTLLQTAVNRSHAYVASAADGNPHAFLMRKSGATITAWIDGVSRSVVSSGLFTGLPGATTDTIYVYGSSANGALSWNNGSMISGMALFQSALTDTECVSISNIQRAWGQLFAPLPRRIWAPSATAAATFKPAWAIGSNAVIGAGAMG